MWPGLTGDGGEGGIGVSACVRFLRIHPPPSWVGQIVVEGATLPGGPPLITHSYRICWGLVCSFRPPSLPSFSLSSHSSPTLPRCMLFPGLPPPTPPSISPHASCVRIAMQAANSPATDFTDD